MEAVCSANNHTRLPEDVARTDSDSDFCKAISEEFCGLLLGTDVMKVK